MMYEAYASTGVFLCLLLCGVRDAQAQTTNSAQFYTWEVRGGPFLVPRLEQNAEVAASPKRGGNAGLFTIGDRGWAMALVPQGGACTVGDATPVADYTNALLVPGTDKAEGTVATLHFLASSWETAAEGTFSVCVSVWALSQGTVAPGYIPANISVTFSGASSIRISGFNSLAIGLPAGQTVVTELDNFPPLTALSGTPTIGIYEQQCDGNPITSSQVEGNQLPTEGLTGWYRICLSDGSWILALDQRLAVAGVEGGAPPLSEPKEVLANSEGYVAITYKNYIISSSSQGCLRATVPASVDCPPPSTPAQANVNGEVLHPALPEGKTYPLCFKLAIRTGQGGCGDFDPEWVTIGAFVSAIALELEGGEVPAETVSPVPMMLGRLFWLHIHRWDKQPFPLEGRKIFLLKAGETDCRRGARLIEFNPSVPEGGAYGCDTCNVLSEYDGLRVCHERDGVVQYLRLTVSVVQPHLALPDPLEVEVGGGIVLNKLDFELRMATDEITSVVGKGLVNATFDDIPDSTMRLYLDIPGLTSHAQLIPLGGSTGLQLAAELPLTSAVASNPAAEIFLMFHTQFGGEFEMLLDQTIKVSSLDIAFIKPFRAWQLQCVKESDYCFPSGPAEEPTNIGAMVGSGLKVVLQGDFEVLRFAVARYGVDRTHQQVCNDIIDPGEMEAGKFSIFDSSTQQISTQLTFGANAFTQAGAYTLCVLSLAADARWRTTGFSFLASVPPLLVGEIDDAVPREDDKSILLPTENNPVRIFGLKGAPLEFSLWFGRHNDVVRDPELTFQKAVRVEVGIYPRACTESCGTGCRKAWFYQVLEGVEEATVSEPPNLRYQFRMTGKQTLQFLADADQADMHVCAAIFRTNSAGGDSFDGYFHLPLNIKLAVVNPVVAGYPSFPLTVVQKDIFKFSSNSQLLPLFLDTFGIKPMLTSFNFRLGVKFLKGVNSNCTEKGPEAYQKSMGQNVYFNVTGVERGTYAVCMTVKQPVDPARRTPLLVPWTRSDLILQSGTITGVAGVTKGRIGLPMTAGIAAESTPLELSVEGNVAGISNAQLGDRFINSVLSVYFEGPIVDPSAPKCSGINWTSALAPGKSTGLTRGQNSATLVLKVPPANLAVGNTFNLCFFLHPADAIFDDWWKQLPPAFLPWLGYGATAEVLPFFQVNGRRSQEDVRAFVGLPIRIEVCDTPCFSASEAANVKLRIAPQGECTKPRTTQDIPWLPDPMPAKVTSTGVHFDMPSVDSPRPESFFVEALDTPYDLCFGDNRFGQMRGENDFATMFVKLQMVRVKLSDKIVSVSGAVQNISVPIKTGNEGLNTVVFNVHMSLNYLNSYTEANFAQATNFDRWPLWFSLRRPGECGTSLGSTQVSDVPRRVSACSNSLELPAASYASVPTTNPAWLDLCIAFGSLGGGQSCGDTDCVAPADKFFQMTGIQYAVVKPKRLKVLQSPATHIYPSFGFGPPVISVMRPSPVLLLVDENEVPLNVLERSYPILIETYACEMPGVLSCIRACEARIAQDVKYFLPVLPLHDVNFCTDICEDESLARCEDASGSWVWSGETSAWVSESGDSNTVTAGIEYPNRQVTRVVTQEDYAYAGQKMVFGANTSLNTTSDERAVLLRARFRVWYKLKFSVLGTDIQPANTSAFRLKACYEWSEAHNSSINGPMQWLSSSTRSGDSDNPFPTDARIEGSYYAVAGGSVCKECPTGAVCDGTTLMLTDSRQGVGYWRADMNSSFFYACDSTEGGLEGCMSLTPTGTCTEAYLPHEWPFVNDPVCTLCADGYGKGNTAGRCAPCAAAWATWTVAVVLVIVFLLLVLIMVVSNLKSSRANDKDEFSILVKMLLSHLQIVSLIAILFEKLGSLGRQIFGVAKQASGDALGRMVALDCIFPKIDYYWKFSLIMVLPVFFVAFAWLIFFPILSLVVFMYERKKKKREELLEGLRKDNRGKGFFGSDMPTHKRRSIFHHRASTVVPFEGDTSHDADPPPIKSPESALGQRVVTIHTDETADKSDARSDARSDDVDPFAAVDPLAAVDPGPLKSPKVNEYEYDRITDLFKALDADSDGFIAKQELFNGLARINRQRAEQPAVFETLCRYGLQRLDQLDSLWATLDASDKDGRVTLEEFDFALTQLRKSVRQTSHIMHNDVTDPGTDDQETASEISDEAGIDKALGFRVSAAKDRFRAYVASLVIFAFIVYPDLLTACANMLTCRTFEWGNGIQRNMLKVDMSVNCDDNEYQSYFFGAIMMMISYGVGLPVVFVFLHVIVQGFVFVHDRAELAEQRVRTRLKHARYMFGFLTAGYKRETWYWEAFIMLRKLLTVIIANSGLIHSLTLRSYLLMWVMMVFFGLQLHYQPYAWSKLNQLEERSIQVIIATISLTLLYVQPEEPDNGAFVDEGSGPLFYILTIFILGINILLALYFVYYILFYVRATIATALLQALVHDDGQFAGFAGARPNSLVLWLMRSSRNPRCGGTVMSARDEENGRRTLATGKLQLTLLNKQKFCGDVRGSDGKKGEPPPLRNILVVRRKQTRGFLTFRDTLVGSRVSYIPSGGIQRQVATVHQIVDPEKKKKDKGALSEVSDAEEENLEQKKVILKLLHPAHSHPSSLQGDSINPRTSSRAVMEGERPANKAGLVEETAEYWQNTAEAVDDLEWGDPHSSIAPHVPEMSELCVGTRVVRSRDWTEKWESPTAPFSEGNGGGRGALSVDNGNVDVVMPNECPYVLEWRQPGDDSSLVLTEPEQDPFRTRWEDMTGAPVWAEKGNCAGDNWKLYLSVDPTEMEELMDEERDDVNVCWVLSRSQPSLSDSQTEALSRVPAGSWRSPSFPLTKAMLIEVAFMFPHNPGIHSRWERKDAQGKWSRVQTIFDLEVIKEPEVSMMDSTGLQLANIRVLEVADESPGARVDAEVTFGEEPGTKIRKTLKEVVESNAGRWVVTGFLAWRAVSDKMDAAAAFRSAPNEAFRVRMEADDKRSVFVEVPKKSRDLSSSLVVTLDHNLEVKTIQPGPAANKGVDVGWRIVEVETWERPGDPGEMEELLNKTKKSSVRIEVSQAGMLVPANGVGTVIALDSTTRLCRIMWSKRLRCPTRGLDFTPASWIFAADNNTFKHRLGGHGLFGKRCVDVRCAPGYECKPGVWRAVAWSDVIPSKSVSAILAYVRWRSEKRLDPADFDPHVSVSDEGKIIEDDERMRVVVKKVHRTNFWETHHPELLDSSRHPKSTIVYEECTKHGWSARRVFTPPPRLSQAEFDKPAEDGGLYPSELVTSGGESFDRSISLGMFKTMEWSDSYRGVRLMRTVDTVEMGLILKAINEIEIDKVEDIEDAINEFVSSVEVSDQQGAGRAELVLTFLTPERKVVEGFTGGQYTASDELLRATEATDDSAVAHVAIEFQVWMPEFKDILVICPLSFKQQYSMAVQRWAHMYRHKDPTLPERYTYYKETEPGLQVMVLWESPVEGGLLQPPEPPPLRRGQIPGGGDPLTVMERAQEQVEEEQEQLEQGANLEEVNTHDVRIAELEGEIDDLKLQNDDILVRLKKQWEYRPYPRPGPGVKQQPWRVGCSSIDDVIDEDKKTIEQLIQSLDTLLRLRQDLEIEIARAKEAPPPPRPASRGARFSAGEGPRAQGPLSDTGPFFTDDSRRQRSSGGPRVVRTLTDTVPTEAAESSAPPPQSSPSSKEMQAMLKAKASLEEQVRALRQQITFMQSETLQKGGMEDEMRVMKQQLKSMQKETQIAWETEEKSRENNQQLRKLVVERETVIGELQEQVEGLMEEQARLIQDAADYAARERIAEEHAEAERQKAEEASEKAAEASSRAEAAAKRAADLEAETAERMAKVKDEEMRLQLEKQAAAARQEEKDARAEEAKAAKVVQRIHSTLRSGSPDVKSRTGTGDGERPRSVDIRELSERRERENRELREKLARLEREKEEREVEARKQSEEAEKGRARRAEREKEREDMEEERRRLERKRSAAAEGMAAAAIRMAGQEEYESSEDSDAEIVPLRTRDSRGPVIPMRGTQPPLDMTTPEQPSFDAASTATPVGGVARTLQEKLREQDVELTAMLGKDWMKNVQDGMRGQPGRKTPPREQPLALGRKPSKASKPSKRNEIDAYRQQAYEGGGYIPPEERLRAEKKKKRKSRGWLSTS
eukprot:Hpha_TRINITY_DN16437_c6_g6::TRINITY_DN16437_c6_g6_i1::g.159769::m.159769